VVDSAARPMDWLLLKIAAFGSVKRCWSRVASESCISSLWIEVCKSTSSLESLLRKISTFVSVIASTSTQAEYTGRNRLYSGGTCTYQEGANAKGLTSTLDLDWTRIRMALA